MGDLTRAETLADGPPGYSANDINDLLDGLTINNRAVTMDKLPAYAQHKFLARSSGGSGSLEEQDITAAALAMLAQSDVGMTTLEHTGADGVNETISNSGVFDTSGHPTVELTPGTWLVIGSTSIWQSSLQGAYLRFTDAAGANAFGSSGGTTANATANGVNAVTVTGIVTVAAEETFDVHFHVTTTNSCFVGAPTVSTPCGHITAVRLGR